MGFTTLENTPIDINLVTQSVTTGWSFSGDVATHEACNAGSIYLNGYTVEAGQTYEISYEITSITGSAGVLYTQVFMGDTAGTERITTGFFTETLLCSGTSPRLRFYSTADCTVEIFNIRNTAVDTGERQKNNIVYNEIINKWSDFRTYNPDCGFGLFINLYTFKEGNLYLHENNSSSRNNFYGTQYESIIKLPFNQNVSFVSTFESMSIQGNMLMITTDEGVETSLGQVSDLIAEDFTKSTLSDGTTTVTINELEGVYSASFMRDINSVGGIVNGDALKGNWLLVEIKTTESTKLRLFSVAVHSEKSPIGVRN